MISHMYIKPNNACT